MKKTFIFVFSFLIALSAALPGVLAAPQSEFYVADTDGTPVLCGQAAAAWKSELQTAGITAWPVMTDAHGSPLSAETLAATGQTISYIRDDAAVSRIFILKGDVNGSGTFNISQLVTLARFLTGTVPSPLQLAAGDINGSGRIDVADLVLLAGWIRDARPAAPAVPYPEPDAQQRALVVYFSATGSTKRIAEMIAAELDADIFALTPKDPYTAADLDYSDPDSRVSREHADPALRSVPLEQSVIPALDSYDNIYLGYPIWWGIAAWPVNTFLADNDLGSASVWCFCTSASSGLGQSAELLAQEAHGGTWLGGRRFSAGASADEVSDWLVTLP